MLRGRECGLGVPGYPKEFGRHSITFRFAGRKTAVFEAVEFRLERGVPIATTGATD